MSAVLLANMNKYMKYLYINLSLRYLFWQSVKLMKYACTLLRFNNVLLVLILLL